MSAGGAKQERPVIWPTPGKSGHSSQGRESGPLSRRRRLRKAGLGLLIAAILILLASGVAYWRLTTTVTSYPGSHFNLHSNGVWLEHSWASEAHSGSDYDALANVLADEQVTYVYAHVGYFNSNGTIPADDSPNAAALVSQLHARLPGVHVLAWMGQGDVPDGTPEETTVNLDDSSVRAQIAATAAHFVQDLGFDGVIYDIEPILNNNPRYIDLLEETRADLPSGAILSTIGQKWAPNAHIADFLRSQGKAGAWWTTYYYADVAAHVDQIVPLIYNSAMPNAPAYELFVQQETEHILDAVRSANHPPQVLISLPTYPGNSFWFHDTAENMTTGLSGVIAGLNSNRDTSAFTGVAIYRFAYTSRGDWSIYDSLWLGK